MKKDVETFIKEHNHIEYCEAIIHPDGMIEYAYPSHTEALIRITGKSRDEVDELMPVDELPIYWLTDYTKCVAVWYGMVITPTSSLITPEQSLTLKRLEEEKIIYVGIYSRLSCNHMNLIGQEMIILKDDRKICKLCRADVTVQEERMRQVFVDNINKIN